MKAKDFRLPQTDCITGTTAVPPEDEKEAWGILITTQRRVFYLDRTTGEWLEVGTGRKNSEMVVQGAICTEWVGEEEAREAAEKASKERVAGKVVAGRPGLRILKPEDMI